MVAPSGDDRPAETDAALDRYRTARQARQEARVSARRRVLQWVIGIGAGAFSVALLLPALAIRSLTQATKDVATGDTLVYATGSQTGSPIDAQAIQPGTAVQAFPRGKSDNERNLIELVRLGDDLPASLVAYSAICTHLGCTVLPNLTGDGDILCPCHASLFDPADGAKVLSGPANRPLPSLPVEISAQGEVVVAGAFSGPIGPQ